MSYCRRLFCRFYLAVACTTAVKNNCNYNEYCILTCNLSLKQDQTINTSVVIWIHELKYSILSWCHFEVNILEASCRNLYHGHCVT